MNWLKDKKGIYLLDTIIKQNDINPSCKIVLSQLIYFCDKSNDSSCNPSISYLSNRCGISKRKIIDIIERLIEKQYITRSMNYLSDTHYNASNTYNLTEKTLHLLEKDSDLSSPYSDVSSQSHSDFSSSLDSDFSSPMKKNNKKIKKESKKDVSLTYDDLISEYTQNTQLIETLHEFIKMRNLINAKLSNHALKILFTRLDNIAKDDDEKIKILEESILNNWKGVFPIKNKEKQNVAVATHQFDDEIDKEIKEQIKNESNQQ
ncbi:MAG: helix-turn-helix domain-containing protein [Erysipelotrichaceae bacterium]|nr:helix-turn-helix domain-containing protein [Erysipelotrichaceae bacterium]